MSDGYSVLMTDLLAMARTFSTESQTISAAVRTVGPAAVNGGDATINGALAGALQAAALTTGQLAAVAGSHGAKLNGAYQKYHDTEETNAQLARQLTSIITGK